MCCLFLCGTCGHVEFAMYQAFEKFNENLNLKKRKKEELEFWHKKKKKRLTNEDMIIRGVGEDDRIAEQSGGVSCGGGWSHVGEGDTLAHGMLCGGHSEGGAGYTEVLGFRFRDVLEGWS